jgi:hypothetical protein
MPKKTCPGCNRDVLPMADGTCPACRQVTFPRSEAASEQQAGSEPSPTGPPPPTVPERSDEEISPGEQAGAKAVFTKSYVAMLIVAVLLGIVTGALIQGRRRGLVEQQYTDASFIASFLIIIPLFALVDAIRNRDFLLCPLRAASLPILEGAAIFAITQWIEPLLMCCLTGGITGVGSFIVVAVTRFLAGGRR